MELSVLQMGGRMCFVAAVLLIVGRCDPHLEEHLSLLAQVRECSSSMRG